MGLPQHSFAAQCNGSNSTQNPVVAVHNKFGNIDRITKPPVLEPVTVEVVEAANKTDFTYFLIQDLNGTVMSRS